jgi:hypothetical protein
MSQRSILALVGALALVLTPITVVVADQVFHSQRLSFFLTEDGALAGHPELRSGHVVDIHPNGPVNAAHERYMINGAKANHTYAVVLRIFDDACDGTSSAFDMFQTVTLITNNNGNAHGKTTFPAEIIVEPPVFVSIYWTLVDENEEVAYRTDCILVGIDALPLL